MIHFQNQDLDQNIMIFHLEIEQGQYYYTRYSMKYATDQSKKWSLKLGYNFGNFYNGTRKTTIFSCRFAPMPHFSLSMNFEQNILESVGINQKNLSTNLITLGSRIALNPRLQFSAFYQYNDFDTQGRWNVRASWEYLPQSFVYFVFNDMQRDHFENPIRQQQLISKVSFVKQF